MKKRKRKPKKQKEPDMKHSTKRHDWQIVRLPNGDFVWMVK